jgi:hypothetical protein
MGRVTKIESSKSPPLREVWVLTKPPIYDLSTMLGQSLEGLSPYGSSSHDLVLGSYVRGVSLPHHMTIGFSLPIIDS